VDLLTHYIQIILLGIVEGVTEFLPISSTGHLLIAEALGLGHEPDVFNVVIQAGAILAVVLVYWTRITGLLGHLENPAGRAYLMKIALAFAVTSVISLVLIKHFKLHLPETLTPVAWATLIGGFVIFAVEFLSKNLYPHEDVSWIEAAAMGAAQVVAAAFPGASRSGSTIMTGLALGMKRTAATEFSFLLGIPTMFAASALDLFRYRKQLTGHDHQLIIDIVLGFVVSAIVAFFVVKWLLHFIQSHTFNSFAIYRVILGAALLIALATHAIPDVGTASEETAPTAKIEVPATLPPSPPAPDTNAPVPTIAPAATPTTNTDSSSSAPAPTNAAPEVAPSNNASTMPDSSVPAAAVPVTTPAPAPPAPPATNPAPANVPAAQ
jgi:undecaprenyl-diphosphatase